MSRGDGIWIMIDPGTWTHGLVVIASGEVIHADAAATTDDVHLAIRHTKIGTVLVERVQAQGITGNSTMITCEHSSDFRRLAIESGHETHRIYRQAVKSALGVVGKSSDAIVRARLCETLGAGSFDRGKLCSKRKSRSHGAACTVCGGTDYAETPGMFSAVRSHAIQALGLWLAFDVGAREKVHTKPARTSLRKGNASNTLKPHDPAESEPCVVNNQN